MAVAIGGTSTRADGSGVTSLSVSHTAAGTDRAAWIGGGGRTAPPPPGISSATYGGNAATAAYAQVDSDATGQRGFYIAGDANVPTGAQTVQINFASSASECSIVVISLQGVDSSAPVGTPATTSGDPVTSLSVTVGSVGADDMLTDFFYGVAAGTTAGSGPGAGQTTQVESVFNDFYYGASSQDGADGGVMSWTSDGTGGGGTTLGAIAFKPLAVDGNRILFPPSLDGMGVGGRHGGSRVH
jgi:hypothetical protein